MVAQPHVSAQSVAQQQVLTQQHQWEAAAEVAQQAAAEKLQIEQAALEKDFRQLREDQARYGELLAPCVKIHHSNHLGKAVNRMGAECLR